MTSAYKQFGDGSSVSSGFSCGQIEAERNHDKLHIRPTLISSRTKTGSLATYYLDLDNSHTHCNNFATTNSPQWTDLGFINFIFNTADIDKSKQEVWDRGLTTSHQCQYVGQAWIVSAVPGNKLGPQSCNGYIYSFQNLSTKKTSRRHLINTIKHHSGSLGAYMFVDVGKWILDILNEESTSQDPIFHIINSQASLADSATEGKGLYANNFFKNNLFCWWYMEDLVVPSYNTASGAQPNIPYNYMYHSGFECWMGDAGAANPACTLIKQWWYKTGNYGPNHTNYVYMSDNANYHNNRTYINAQIDKLAKNSNTTNELYSLCYHRKRSGDGFSIWFMEQFATILAQQGDYLFYPCCAQGNDDPFGDPPNVPAKYSLMGPLAGGPTTKQRIRKRSYFITGDWPAFCWAAYCHCNAIFQCSGQGGWAIMFVADNTKVCY
jgi:hypothetical protein